MAAPQKVLFTVRRPTPISRATSSGPDSDNPSFKVPNLPRHLVQSVESTPSGSPLARSESPATNGYDNSSDEDDEVQDELVTGFDRFGVQRCVHSFPKRPQSSQLTEVSLDHSSLHRLHEDERKKKSEPLVIPALKNKDWRELARKRRSVQQYVPSSAKAQTGADGSVGGLGTRDVIGGGAVLSGLQTHKKAVKVESIDGIKIEEAVKDIKMEEVELSEDELARRAILAEVNGIASDGSAIDIIPTPVSEGDAYKQDVEELPDVASLEDYARIPVEQFGAAMLRGMGWKEGTAASKNGKGLAQPYLPSARPALLGIGAKEMEVFDDGSKKKKGPIRPERKYVPVIKREREREDTPGSGRERSLSPRRDSRRNSPSRSGDSDRNERRKDKEYNRKRGWERDEDRGTERGKDKYREKERDRGRYDGGEDKREKDRQRDHDRDRSDRRDRSRDSSRRRRGY